jgi:hypothetical protein
MQLAEDINRMLRKRELVRIDESDPYEIMRREIRFGGVKREAEGPPAAVPSPVSSS